jgi:MFS family permease
LQEARAGNRDREGLMRGERWLIFAVLFLARTCMGLQFATVGALSPLLRQKLGIDYAQLGLLIGLYLLPGIVIAFPGGLLGQRYGDKRVVLFGMTMMVLGGALGGFGDQYGAFLAGRVVSGAGGVLINVLLIKMTTDWFIGREIGTALAVLADAWPIGIGVALAGLPALAARQSPLLAFAAPSLATAAMLALVALLYRAPGEVAPLPSTLRFGLSAREFGLVSLAGGVWMLFNVGYILVVNFAPPLLMEHGLTAVEAGFATSLATWTTVVTAALGGILSDRIGRGTALMAGTLALLGAIVFLTPLAPSAGMLAFVGAIAGIPVAGMLALPAQMLGTASRGPGMGVFFTWYYLGMAVLVPAAGLARDLAGAASAPLIFAGALEIAAMGIVIVCRVLQRRPADIAQFDSRVRGNAP